MAESTLDSHIETEPTLTPNLLKAQKSVLEMIVRDVPLADVLGCLCRIVEEQASHAVRAAILLVAPDGIHLTTGAAPSLPDSYTRAIDNIAISPFIGTCAAAAARRHSVTTPDIASDPGWQQFKHLPLGIGLKAAWSMPIMSAEGTVLGTFGTYFREAREPLATERQLVEVLAPTAALAIERQAADAALAADLHDTRLLRDLAARLIAEDDASQLFDEILSAAIAISHADAGTIQLLNEGTGDLTFLATCGFGSGILSHFARVDASSGSPCGRALASGERAFVRFDDAGDPDADGSNRLHLEEGMRCAQSTPLISRFGKPVGMFSTHWRKHHRLTEREVRFLDLLGRQAAELIERQRAQDSLRLREEQLRLATDAAEVGLWDVDLVSDTLFWPARVKAMFGISADAAVSMEDFYAGLHPADRQRIGEAFAASLDPALRALYDVEYRTVGKEDGIIRWVAAKGRGIFDSHNQCVRVIGTAIDITARKLETEERARIASALEQNEAHLRAIFGGTYEYIGLLSPDGTLLEANRAALEFGPSLPEEVIGRPFWDTVWFAHTPGAPEKLRESIEHAAAGEFVRYEAAIARPSGEIVTFDFSLHPIKSDTGKVILIVPEGRDISALVQARRAIETADRQKDEFLAMLAHELRNPLAPIRNATEILGRTLPESSSARSPVSIIKRQVTQLTKLVDDLLDVSRITQGRIALVLQPVHLAKVVAQAVETLEPQLRERRHKLSVTSSTGYEPLYVNADFGRLVQCISNLLSNAAKYTDPCGEIWVRTGPCESSAIIEVTDTGAGISPELLPRVFDLFVQSDRTLDRAQGGLGVGLAVVKRLVEMHHGQVAVRSSGLGKGSSFEIRLPRIPRPSAKPTEATVVKSPLRRVLIVDDNADAADSLAMLLSFQGHETHVAYSGKDALASVEAFKPDVALLDLGLPEMDGYELAHQLQAMPNLPGLRLVALTGYGQAETQQRTRAAGFSDHLIKPVNPMALERALLGSSTANP